MSKLSYFKACDIRGKQGEDRQGGELNDETAYGIGCACAQHLNAWHASVGGETRADHYFRDFARCDSTMTPWLPVAEPMSAADNPLPKPTDKRITVHPCSGEVNFRVHNVQADAQPRILAVKNHFQSTSSPVLTDTTDGPSVEFTGCRFNLRPSKTKPLLRFNVENRGNYAQAGKRPSQIETIIKKAA